MRRVSTVSGGVRRLACAALPAAPALRATAPVAAAAAASPMAAARGVMSQTKPSLGFASAAPAAAYGGRGAATVTRGAQERLRFLTAQHYGRDDAPYLGVFLQAGGDGGAVDTETVEARREAYVRGLLAVAGQGRRARDWLAGWAASVPGPGNALIELCMQYDDAESDIASFAQGVLADWEGGQLSDEAKATVFNCFIFDAATMMALSCMNQAEKTELARKRLATFASIAGVPDGVVAEIVALAKEERGLMVEKYRTLYEECTAAPPGYSSPWSSVDFM